MSNHCPVLLQELLALGERIGNVNTGLSEETISSQLKTRRHLLPSISINLEEVPSLEKEAASCIICQVLSCSSFWIRGILTSCARITHHTNPKQIMIYVDLIAPLLKCCRMLMSTEIKLALSIVGTSIMLIA